MGEVRWGHSTCCMCLLLKLSVLKLGTVFCHHGHCCLSDTAKSSLRMEPLHAAVIWRIDRKTLRAADWCSVPDNATLCPYKQMGDGKPLDLNLAQVMQPGSDTKSCFGSLTSCCMPTEQFLISLCWSHPHHLIYAHVKGVHTNGCLRLMHSNLLSHCYHVPQPTDNPHTRSFFTWVSCWHWGFIKICCAAIKIFAKYATNINV